MFRAQCERDAGGVDGTAGVDATGRGGPAPIGRAHFGHAAAWSETSVPQSGHVTRAMAFLRGAAVIAREQRHCQVRMLVASRAHQTR